MAEPYREERNNAVGGRRDTSPPCWADIRDRLRAPARWSELVVRLVCSSSLPRDWILQRNPCHDLPDRRHKGSIGGRDSVLRLGVGRSLQLVDERT
jgi:hypothetical protein